MVVQDIAAQLDGLIQSCGYPAGGVSNLSLNNGCLHVDIRGTSTIWTIKVDVTSAILDQLPTVYLVAPSLLLAHVSHSQIICIDDGQGLSIDTDRPTEIFSNVLFDAFRVLESADIDATKGQPDFFDELEGYCEGMPNGILARTSVEADTTSRLIYGHIENLGKGRKVCWYISEHTGNKPTEFRTSNLANVTGLYVALECNVLPPSPSASLDATFIERIAAAFGQKERQLWERYINKRKTSEKRLCCMLISQPRPSGGRSLIGLTFNLRKGKIDPSGQVRNLVVRRHTPTYMRERGGASTILSTKHVAVLGCGSVGSEIADTLATCGVGRLTLVDFDNLEVENVFRHVLGKDSTGFKKVDALKVELIRKYAGLEVITVSTQALAWLTMASLAEVDSVVIAIGSPATERALARQIRAKRQQLNIVVTWLEALGLGGHIVSLPASGEGCLDCIYRGDEGQESLHPAISFLAPGQEVSQTLSGCLGTFIPYSALHSRKTALLATETVLEVLAGLVESRYKYWVGDDTQAKAKGIETSAWYKRANTLDSTSATKVIFSVPCRYCREES